MCYFSNIHYLEVELLEVLGQTAKVSLCEQVDKFRMNFQLSTILLVQHELFGHTEPCIPGCHHQTLWQHTIAIYMWFNTFINLKSHCFVRTKISLQIVKLEQCT